MHGAYARTSHYGETRKKAIREDVKRSCVKLAQKYLSQSAVRFYESLPSSTSAEENEGSELQ